MSLSSFAIKVLFTLGDRKRDKGLVTPDDIERYDNILYGPHGKWNLLDVYLPKKRNGALPVIISVHGGGWVYGDKDGYQFYCMDLAKRGFAVVNYTYRLAPKYKHPSAMEDTNMVVRWVLNHGEEYGIDKEHIFMVGDSAGAHMAALYSCICTNPEYADCYEFKVPYGFVPNAVALNCGIYSMDAPMGNMEDRLPELMGDLLGRKNVKEKMKSINPCKYVTKMFPPAYIMTSTGDFLKEQMDFMVEILEKYNIPSESKIYGDESNLLPHVFHCNIQSQEARECNDAECEFFGKHMI